MSGQKAKGSKKNRKFLRNKDKCKRYRDEGRLEKNKARKAAKELHMLEKRARKANEAGISPCAA